MPQIGVQEAHQDEEEISTSEQRLLAQDQVLAGSPERGHLAALSSPCNAANEDHK